MLFYSSYNCPIMIFSAKIYTLSRVIHPTFPKFHPNSSPPFSDLTFRPTLRPNSRSSFSIRPSVHTLRPNSRSSFSIRLSVPHSDPTRGHLSSSDFPSTHSDPTRGHLSPSDFPLHSPSRICKETGYQQMVLFNNMHVKQSVRYLYILNSVETTVTG